MTNEADIRPQPFPSLSWQPGDVEASLDELAAWVEDQGAASIGWYLREKRSKARYSRWLRIAAIAFATAGAAVPFVAAIADDVALQWGYLAFALAGAAMAFDRFFGLSSAWMRYLMAELSIQRILQDLRLQRTAMQAARGGSPMIAEDVRSELAALSTAAVAIHAVVEQETLAWVAEFQSNVAELNAVASGKRRSAERPE